MTAAQARQPRARTRNRLAPKWLSHARCALRAQGSACTVRAARPRIKLVLFMVLLFTCSFCQLPLFVCQLPHAHFLQIYRILFLCGPFAPRVPCVRQHARATRAHTMRGRARAMDSRSRMHACACHACARACMCACIVHRRVFVRTRALVGHTKNNLLFCDNRALPCTKNTICVGVRVPWTHVHACMQHARAMRARACMCAGVVHRRVSVHARALVGHTKNNQKMVPLLQTEERF